MRSIRLDVFFYLTGGSISAQVANLLRVDANCSVEPERSLDEGVPQVAVYRFWDPDHLQSRSRGSPGHA